MTHAAQARQPLPSTATDRSSPAGGLWYARCSGPTPLAIALRQGWIAEDLAGDHIALHGLADGGTQTGAAHDRASGRTVRQGDSLSALWAQAQGRDTRLVGLTWTDEFQAVITLPGSGIRQAADLHGRRIGIPRRPREAFDARRATALRGFEQALAGAGHQLLAGAVVIDLPVDGGGDGPGPRRLHPYTAEISALARGEVDAIHVHGVAGAEAAHLLHGRVVVDLGADPDPLVRASGTTLRALTVDGALADHHPDLVARLVGRIRETGTWAAHHGPEVRRAVARELGTTVEWVGFAHGLVHRQLATGLEPDHLRVLADLAGFLRRWRFIDSNFALGGWADPRFLGEPAEPPARRAVA